MHGRPVFCHSQHNSDVEGFICLPRHRSVKGHVGFLSALGANIASALQQWVSGQNQSPRSLFFHLGDGWPLAFKSWYNLWTKPLHVFIAFIFLLIDVAGQRRPPSLKLVTSYTCYNVDMVMFIMPQELLS